MVVTGIGRPVISGAPTRRRAADGRSFGVKAERTGQSEGTVPTEAVAVTSLLALQEAESGLQHDRDAAKQGSAVMDELTDLQCSLLGGDAPDLTRLAGLVARPIGASDPALAGVLRAVRLRAGIELTRRGYAASM